ncbi:hypothetical protein F3Y22_tig00110549pilonHSYRG00071 [Hibiscus syriacus]|uniref:Pentatricopeptide repeat-containing protein n=1 Tax=Hibiscus syriacus TaxID=106335 RepID=A0A6A3ACU8_HIBSY|nr:hypothetical protein F3Y22_tig00110549pilonHSYRG00071 [Hibiscus syriacus]
MVEKSILVYDELDPSLKNTHVRNVLLDVLLRDGRVDRALNVLDEMLQPFSEVPPNDVTGDIVFYALTKTGRSLSEKELVSWRGEIIQAWNFLHELLILTAPLESSLFNVLMSELGRRGDVKRMNVVMAEMKEYGIRPDVVTLGSKNDGVLVEANVVILNTLIDGLCKLERSREGLSCSTVERRGGFTSYNHVNALIDGMCRLGRINSALEFFREMQEKGVVDLFDDGERMLCRCCCYYSLISGFCRAGKMDDAGNVYSKLKAAGFHPDIVCYNSY